MNSPHFKLSLFFNSRTNTINPIVNGQKGRNADWIYSNVNGNAQIDYENDGK
jgi:hypothetical protein